MELFNIYTFWLVVVGICILWYSTVTLFVAIRGGSDIKHMMKRLQSINEGDSAGPPPVGFLSEKPESDAPKPPDNHIQG